MAKDNKDYIPPAEAVEILDNGAPYKIEEEVASSADRESKESELLGSTSQAIQLRKAIISGQIKIERNRQRMEIAKIKALETGREKSKKHLAQFAGIYLTLLVALFLYATQALSPDALAVVASIISIVIVNLSGVLSQVVSEEEPRDSAEMMSEIIHRTLDARDAKEMGGK
jgi:hypothetical protein